MKLSKSKEIQAERKAEKIKRTVFSNIERIAKSKGMSINSLALSMGLHPNELYTIVRANITLRKLCQLSELFGIPLEVLMFHQVKVKGAGNEKATGTEQ